MGDGYLVVLSVLIVLIGTCVCFLSRIREIVVWSKGDCTDWSRKEKEGYMGRIGRGKGVGSITGLYTERALSCTEHTQVVERDWTVCVGTSTFFSIGTGLGVTTPPTTTYSGITLSDHYI